jgi:hypothetical protein
LFLPGSPPAAIRAGAAIVLFAVFAHAARDLNLARAASAESIKCITAKKI